MWIDTHCHLDAAELTALDGGVAAVLQRAADAGVTQLVVPAVARNNFAIVQQISAKFAKKMPCTPISKPFSSIASPQIFYTLGIHPLYVHEAKTDDLRELREQIEAVRSDENFIGIGEIGLDGFVPNLDLNLQLHHFTAQLKLAREFELPVILHVRRAQDIVLRELRRFGLKNGIAHAFNGSEQQAQAFIQQGFLLGFGGAMTFTRALQIRRLAQALPLEALVLETDAPDIAPAWLNAADTSLLQRAPNQPAQLPRIGAMLAELRGQTSELIARATAANFARVFDLRLA